MSTAVAPSLDGLGLTLFVVSNIAISLGYVYAGLRVAPHFILPSTVARLAGVLFFALCAYTHVEQVAHVLDPDQYPGLAGSAGSAHMVWPHVAQAVAIWTFVLGMRAFVMKLGRNELDERIAYAFTADPFWRKAPVMDLPRAPGVERRIGPKDRRRGWAGWDGMERRERRRAE